MKFLSVLVVVLVALPLVLCSGVYAEGKKKEWPTSPVNINTASKQEIQQIPGLGDKTAEAIISGRPWSSLDDLSKIKGFSAKKIARMKEKKALTTGKDTAPAAEAVVGKTEAVPEKVEMKKEEPKEESKD
ncbi:MAG: helix-hairpin-helix domain-containing protein [Candidatus Aureabacteria bacterium]|nr:helix-hairpin-helix domain-containing protein [Candidatus Auribacterota bacterium]